MVGFIRELYIFPIKSGAPVAVSEIELGPRGPRWDRHWLIVDSHGRFLTQRDQGELSGVQPFLKDGAWFARLPDHRELSLTSLKTERRAVQIWKDTVQAWDCGDEWAQALQECFEKPWRMVEMPDEPEARLVNNPLVPWSQPVGFADAEPMLLVNQASVSQMEDKLGITVGALRFRPNIVIEGLEAFSERDIAQWEINGVRFQFSKMCSRCVMVTLDPITGEKQYPQVLTWLAKNQLIDGKARFGAHIVAHPERAAAVSRVALQVGQKVKAIHSN
jgi:uncharacterized protein YcbX